MSDWLVALPGTHGRFDGIGDYSLALARALNLVHPTRLEDLDGIDGGTGAVFVQYSPPRVRSDERRRLTSYVDRVRASGRPMIVTIHEYWPPQNGTLRRWWQCRVMRRTLAAVAAHASAIITTQEISARQLRESGVTGDLSIAVIPVGSNVERTVEPPGERTGGVVMFGQPAAMDPDAVRDVAQWLADRGTAALTWFGRSSDEMRQWWDAHIGVASRHVTFAGALPAAAISRLLQSATAGLALYADGASARRTTLAALLHHGVPTVALPGIATDRWLRDSSALAWVSELGETSEAPAAFELSRLLDDAPRRARMSHEAMTLYEKHMGWPLIAAAYAAAAATVEGRGR